MNTHSFAAITLALTAATAAHAVDVTRTFDFSASGFPADAPTQLVKGMLEVTYGAGEPVTIDDFSINIPIGSEVAGWYYLGFGGYDLLQVGGVANAVNGVAGYSDDVDFAVSDSKSASPHGSLDYTSINSGDAFVASDVSIKAMGVLEPASWTLMIIGAGATGGVLRQRRSGLAA